jgi:DNA-binding transcriptional MerR regulator
VTDGWTLEELVARVAEALAADGVRAPNGRVREVPDGRALRWYATIGLLDRPSAFRGRTALYGPRHLLQAVAVKRRQAEGMALAQIQAELSGATDATLHRVARLPARLLTDAPPPVRPPRPSFWRTAPAPMSAVSSPAAEPVGVAPARAEPVAVAAAGAEPDHAERAHLIRLGPGATLVLTAAPSAADVADLRAAAAPLIRLLADRALLTAEESRHDDH